MDLNTLLQQAIQLFENGSYSKAEAAFQQLHQAKSSFLSTLYLAQLAQLRQEGACWISPLEEALTQHRGSADGYYILGHSYQQNHLERHTDRDDYGERYIKGYHLWQHRHDQPRYHPR